MIHVLVIAVCAMGFLALAAAQKRHQRDLVRRTLSAREVRAARMGGAALLVFALVLDGRAFGLALGLLTWTGHLALAAGAIVALLVVRKPA